MKPFEKPTDDKVIFDSATMPEFNQIWGTGCDQDLGGFSTARITRTKEGKLRFNGNLSLALKPGSEAMYSGYAAMRTHMRLPKHAFDDRSTDCSKWNYLVMRIRGDHRTYTINFKTSRSFAGDLYLAKFKFNKPYEWETVVLPFQYFFRSNCGTEYPRQTPPNMEKVSSLGFLLADNLPGPFNLDLDYIKVTNFGYKYENLPENSPEIQGLLQHLVDPKRKRLDTRDNLSDNFGIGSETGGRILHTAEERASKRWDGASANRIDNPNWKIEFNSSPDQVALPKLSDRGSKSLKDKLKIHNSNKENQ